MRQAHWCPVDSGQRQMLLMSRALKSAMMICTVGICRSQTQLLGRTRLGTTSDRVHKLRWISLRASASAGGSFARSLVSHAQVAVSVAQSFSQACDAKLVA